MPSPLETWVWKLCAWPAICVPQPYAHGTVSSQGTACAWGGVHVSDFRPAVHRAVGVCAGPHAILRRDFGRRGDGLAAGRTDGRRPARPDMSGEAGRPAAAAMRISRAIPPSCRQDMMWIFPIIGDAGREGKRCPMPAPLSRASTGRSAAARGTESGAAAIPPHSSAIRPQCPARTGMVSTQPTSTRPIHMAISEMMVTARESPAARIAEGGTYASLQTMGISTAPMPRAR